MSRFARVLAALSLLLAACPLAAVAAELQAGVAVADVTPPVPYRMCGYFEERVSTGVKDPLLAKAIYFEQGETAAALVFCDLIGVPRQVTAAARLQASEALKIPPENIAIMATHSHTGPSYYDALRDHYHEKAIALTGKDPLEKIDYRAELTDKLVQAIVAAAAAAQPVELRSGYAVEPRLSFNRRYHMKDGSVRFNPGLLNPDIVRAAGPIDPQVGLVELTAPDAEQPLAAVVAFALHLDTTSGTEYSGDYPKFTQDRLRKTLGRNFISLFGAATCGDINHLDVTTTEVRRPEVIGSMLAETIEAAFASESLPRDEPALAVRSATVNAPLQQYPPARVAQAKANMDLVGTRELSFLDQVEAYKITALQAYDGRTLPFEVQAFRLGRDTAIVTLPGEMFVELGLAIKAASPFRTTIVIELANDAPGYIPTKKAFAEGSYETVNSVVEPGVGEALVETANRLLKELK
jgi:hypothetical protein